MVILASGVENKKVVKNVAKRAKGEAIVSKKLKFGNIFSIHFSVQSNSKNCSQKKYL